MRLLPTLLIVIISYYLGGCVSILDASSKGPIIPDPTKRSFGSLIDDRQLKTITSVNINKADPLLSKSHINVHSYNSVILLIGQVPSKELRELAGETARNISRVRQVYNELEISPNISFGQRTKDNWLETKIDSKLFATRDIQSDRVEVIVENNVVYLMGLLTLVQVEKITDVIRNTKGVTKVVRAIEYIEEE